MYTAKNFDRLMGLDGLSEQLLKNHFALYSGYVVNTNKLAEELKSLADSDKISSLEYAELKRRFGWEFNGMRLHEYYFGNLTKGGIALDHASPLARAIEENFGSLKNWEKDFRATGAMRGIGWVVLMQDNESGKLFNVWINEHDLGLLSDSKILLVMDVFEHAFMLDYGIKRANYIEVFFQNINWEAVIKRLV